MTPTIRAVAIDIEEIERGRPHAGWLAGKGPRPLGFAAARVAKAGHRGAYVPEAWVYHDQSGRNDLRRLLRRKYRYNVGATMAYLKNGTTAAVRALLAAGVQAKAALAGR